jgi:YD repeat-containing protein
MLAERYATIRSKYNHNGKLTEQRYYDDNGKPCLSRDGNHGGKTEYDDHGNEIVKTWIGLNGKAMKMKSGYATIRKKYDSNRNTTKWACFDEKGQPTSDQTDGTHKIRYEYNQLGEEVNRRYYDTDGKPIPAIPIVTAKEVTPSSIAEEKGIKAEDIFLQIGQWVWKDVEKDPEFKILVEEMEQFEEKNKRIMIYREGNVYTYDFPPGKIEVRFDADRAIGEQIDKIRQAYESYQKQKRQ